MTPPRVTVLPTQADVDAELERLGADRSGRAIMAPKGVLHVVRISGLDPRGANILKQEFLSKGGDCALPKDVYDLGAEDRTDALILATNRCYQTVLKLLPSQPFGLKELGAELAEALRRAEEPVDVWQCGQCAVPVGKATQVMGVVNVTPDSFSDAGDHLDAETAVAAGLAMVSDGADILDVGGESTRPGSAPVDEAEEVRRLLPVIERLASDSSVPVSVDTTKPAVAREALAAGASIVNDVRGFRDAEMIDAVTGTGCGVVAMHMLGEPATMQDEPHYDDLVGDIYQWLAARAEALAQAGVESRRVAIDPGIGFGKTFEQNLDLIRRLGEFASLGLPVVLGASRKRFIGEVLGIDDPKDRLEGTAATVALGVANGAQVVRVHDVKAMARVARMADAVRTGRFA